MKKRSNTESYVDLVVSVNPYAHVRTNERIETREEKATEKKNTWKKEREIQQRCCMCVYGYLVASWSCRCLIVFVCVYWFLDWDLETACIGGRSTSLCLLHTNAQAVPTTIFEDGSETTTTKYETFCAQSQRAYLYSKNSAYYGLPVCSFYLIFFFFFVFFFFLFLCPFYFVTYTLVRCGSSCVCIIDALVCGFRHFYLLLHVSSGNRLHTRVLVNIHKNNTQNEAKVEEEI